MEISLITAIALFAFVMSITPGPNNIMLLASGAQFGYQRTLPHIVGILMGVAMLLLLVLLGLGALFTRYPEVDLLLKWIGGGYLSYLAWKIATASTANMSSQQPSRGPMSVLEALLFQFVNPKAWAMSIGSISTFTLNGDQYLASGLCIMICFACTGFIAISLWAYSGEKIAACLTTPAQQKMFNRLMGVLTMATLFFIVN